MIEYKSNYKFIIKKYCFICLCLIQLRTFDYASFMTEKIT